MFEGDIRFFTRTIVQDLETRQLVQKLSLELMLPGTWDDNDVTPERRCRMPSMEEEQWSYDRCLTEAISLLGPGISSAGVGGADILGSGAPEDLNLDETPEEDLAALLLFVLPELRYLRVKLEPMTALDDCDGAGYWRCDMLLQTLRLPHYARIQQPGRASREIQNVVPASLFHLEELVMCNPFEEPGTIKSSYPPIVFCSLGDMQPLWGLPNLKSTTLERTIWQEHIRNSQLIPFLVENLDLLDTVIRVSELPLVLQRFPSLRSITYAPTDLQDLRMMNYQMEEPTKSEFQAMFNSDGIKTLIRSSNPRLDKVTVITGLGIDRALED
jgi:hypothetical protein